MIRDYLSSILKKTLLIGALSAQFLFGQNIGVKAQTVGKNGADASFFKNDSTVLIDNFPENPTPKQTFLMNMIKMGQKSKPVKIILDSLAANNIPILVDQSSKHAGYFCADKKKHRFVAIRKINNDFNHTHVTAYNFDTFLEEIVHGYDNVAMRLDISADSLNLAPADYYRFKYNLEASAKARKSYLFIDVVSQIGVPLENLNIWQEYKKTSPYYAETAAIMEKALAKNSGDKELDIAEGVAEVYFRHYYDLNSPIRNEFRNGYYNLYARYYKHDNNRLTRPLTNNTLQKFGQIPGGVNFLKGFDDISAPAFCLFGNDEWNAIDGLNKKTNIPEEEYPIQVENSTFWVSGDGVKSLQQEWLEECKTKYYETLTIIRYKDEILKAIDNKKNKIEKEIAKNSTGDKALSDSLQNENALLDFMRESVVLTTEKDLTPPRFSVRETIYKNMGKYDFDYAFDKSEIINDNKYKEEASGVPNNGNSGILSKIGFTKTALTH